MIDQEYRLKHEPTSNIEKREGDDVYKHDAEVIGRILQGDVDTNNRRSRFDKVRGATQIPEAVINNARVATNAERRDRNVSLEGWQSNFARWIESTDSETRSILEGILGQGAVTKVLEEARDPITDFSSEKLVVHQIYIHFFTGRGEGKNSVEYLAKAVARYVDGDVIKFRRAWNKLHIFTASYGQSGTLIGEKFGETWCAIIDKKTNLIADNASSNPADETGRRVLGILRDPRSVFNFVGRDREQSVVNIAAPGSNDEDSSTEHHVNNKKKKGPLGKLGSAITWPIRRPVSAGLLGVGGVIAGKALGEGLERAFPVGSGVHNQLDSFRRTVDQSWAGTELHRIGNFFSLVGGNVHDGIQGLAKGADNTLNNIGWEGYSTPHIHHINEYVLNADEKIIGSKKVDVADLHLKDFHAGTAITDAVKHVGDFFGTIGHDMDQAVQSLHNSPDILGLHNGSGELIGIGLGVSAITLIAEIALARRRARIREAREAKKQNQQGRTRR